MVLHDDTLVMSLSVSAFVALPSAVQDAMKHIVSKLAEVHDNAETLMKLPQMQWLLPFEIQAIAKLMERRFYTKGSKVLMGPDPNSIANPN